MALGKASLIDEDIVIEKVSIARRVGSQSLSASAGTSTRLRCRYARRTMAPPVRLLGLRGCTA
jgi:hypothetical protein